MKLTTWEGGRFKLEGQTTKTFCFVESEGNQFRARVRAIEGWPDDFDLEAYEGCGATEDEAIAKLTNSLPPEPAPRVAPNRNLVSCVVLKSATGRSSAKTKYLCGSPTVCPMCTSSVIIAST